MKHCRSSVKSFIKAGRRLKPRHQRLPVPTLLFGSRWQYKINLSSGVSKWWYRPHCGPKRWQRAMQPISVWKGVCEEHEIPCTGHECKLTSKITLRLLQWVDWGEMASVNYVCHCKQGPESSFHTIWGPWHDYIWQWAPVRLRRV